MNISRHNTDFAFSWFNDTWTVWSNKSSFASSVHNRFNFDHIKCWNTFSNTDNQINFRFDGFKDGISSKWGWYINNRCFSTSCFYAFFNSSKNWYSKMLGASLSFIYSSNNIGSIGNRLLCMESSVLSCHSLNENFCVFINENMWLCFLGVCESSHHSVHERSL